MGTTMDIIETLHSVMRVTQEIYDNSDNMTAKLKCKQICDLCNRGIANERLRDNTPDDKF